MKSLTNHFNEAKTVCGECPKFDPEAPNVKEFENSIKPILQKLKNNADKHSDMFRNANEEGTAIVKGAMDFLIRNIANIPDDCEEMGDNDNYRQIMSDIFSGDYDDMIADDVLEYYDFSGKHELYDCIERVQDVWDNYCKKVVGMAWR